MMVDLTGRAALISGGARGVGLAIAKVMAEQGADVSIGDVANDLLPRAEKELKTFGHRVLAQEMDVTSRPSVDAAVSRVLSDWGHLDILVNNAGVVGGPGWGDSDEDRDIDWEVVLDVNLLGVVRCCKAVISHMTEKRYGKIINISSVAARGGSAVNGRPVETLVKPGSGSPRAGQPDKPAYGVSKAAVLRYTQALAGPLAKYNINVNCICPGRLFTQMGIDIEVRRQALEPALRGSDPAELRHQHVINYNAFGRELLPEDVGKMAAFLASEDARNITGQSIHVDGGDIML
jgi:NAD(P)-dependent dehydrogenase (short-subunit alcohol dehydrogenase family)